MANLSTTTSSPEVPGQALTDAGANEANDTNTSTDNTMAAAEAAATATAAATVTAAEEGEDPLAQGLQTLLNPSIRVTSQTLSSVFLAQQELSGEIQRLASRTAHPPLSLLSPLSPLPPVPHCWGAR